MLTTDQRNEMRRCIVGPCSEAEKNNIRGLLVEIEEPVERRGYWDQPQFKIIRFQEYWIRQWEASHDTPTITAADFIKTYLQNDNQTTNRHASGTIPDNGGEV